jgi:hypothetical protein
MPPGTDTTSSTKAPRTGRTEVRGAFRICHEFGLYWQRSLAIEILTIGLVCLAGFAVASRLAKRKTASVQEATPACSSRTNQPPGSLFERSMTSRGTRPKPGVRARQHKIRSHEWMGNVGVNRGR